MSETLSVTFACQNWLITPAPAGAGQAPLPRADQDWLVVLSGVTNVNMRGDNADNWRRDTITIFPDVETALTDAITKHRLPGPTGSQIAALNLSQWAPFVAVSAGREKHAGAVDAGYAVEGWRAARFLSATDSNGSPAFQIFQGIDVDLAVRNNHATFCRVSYNVTLVGKIVLIANPIE